MPRNITIQPTVEGDKAALTAQGRTGWQNQLIHDLLDALIKAQKDEYTPLPSRYPVDKKGNLLPNRERNLVEDRLLKRLKINRNAEKELANKVYADVDERFRPYIEGLKGQTQKVRELLSNDRNIQSIREGIAADEQELNYLNDLNSRVNSLDFQASPTTTLLPQFKFVKDLIKEMPGKQQALRESLEKKRQYLQDYENASSAFSQEIPEIIDFPSESLGSEFLASESMSDPLVQQAVKDDYDISKDAIRDVLQGPSGRRNAFLNKLEAGGESTLPDASQISDYLSHRNERAGSAVLNELTENYLTNILPKGNLGFMSGAWNSPQRGTHQQSLLRNMHKDAFNTLMKMEADNTKAGLAEAGEQQKRGLFSGQLGSEALNKGIETQVGAAQGLANVEKAQAAEEFGGLEALARIGQEKQQAEENRLLEMQKEFQKQQNRPVENILQAYNAAQSIPNQTMTDTFVQQQQPNYSAIGGYGLGNLATAMMMPAMGYQGRKAGGLVQKFADGGIALPGVPDDQYRQMLEEEAQQMAGTKVQEVNPMASALAKMTDAMAQRYTGMTPIAGSLVDSYEQRAKSQEVNKVRGLNLMQQIHASRIKQQEFLAEMDYKNRKLKSDESQHYATLGETSRHHKTMEEIGREQKSKLKLNQADQQILKDANKALSGSEDLLTELDKADGLLEKIDTGDWSAQNALTKSPYIQGMISKGEQADYDEFDKIYDDFANKSALAFGSKAGARVVEYLRKAKPHRGMSKEAIKNINSNLRHMIEQEQQKAFYVNEGLEKGIAPTSALSEFVKSSADKRKDGKPTEDKTSESTDISQKSSAELRKIAGLE